MEFLAAERARDLLAGAARRAGVRAIVQSKIDNAEGRDGQLYFLPWAPHSSVVPLCCAMVHHGGVGTSHAALRAGVPSVVLPFGYDQMEWARQLKRAGVGECVPFWRATPDSVGAAIRSTIDSRHMRPRAAELAKAMVSEDGTGVATRLLEEFARHPRELDR